MTRTALPRPAVAAARRIVIKLGTRVLTHDHGGLALSRLFALVEAAAELHHADREVLLVSSGAVGLGYPTLGFTRPPEELGERQACAAVGQTRLMGLYNEGFSRLGLACGQVLLTQGDFEDRVRYLNLRSTLATLLRRRVVPVINENDAVSTEELAFREGEGRHVFGDNDKLSALVASKLDAELLVLLTDVAGLFDRNPHKHPDARLISQVDDPRTVDHVTTGRGSAVSRGGMRSKVDAAWVAAKAGCQAVIASGVDAAALPQVLAGEACGTWFPACGNLDARRRWIAFAAAPRGRLYLDIGAVDAVRERGASVLAAGVRQCEGDFREGDIVELLGPDDRVIGRGMVYCDADSARRWCGGTPPAGVRNHHALVHRDHLVLEA